MNKRCNAEFYENGHKKSYKVEDWKENAHLFKDSNGKYTFISGFVTTTEVYYDKDGNVINEAMVEK